CQHPALYEARGDLGDDVEPPCRSMAATRSTAPSESASPFAEDRAARYPRAWRDSWRDLPRFSPNQWRFPTTNASHFLLGRSLRPRSQRAPRFAVRADVRRRNVASGRPGAYVLICWPQAGRAFWRACQTGLNSERTRRCCRAEWTSTSALFERRTATSSPSSCSSSTPG